MPAPASRVLHLALPGRIDLAQAARYLGARGEPDAATLALLERWAPPLLAAADPRGVYLQGDKEALAFLWQGQDV